MKHFFLLTLLFWLVPSHGQAQVYNSKHPVVVVHTQIKWVQIMHHTSRHIHRPISAQPKALPVVLPALHMAICMALRPLPPPENSGAPLLPVIHYTRLASKNLDPYHDQ